MYANPQSLQQIHTQKSQEVESLNQRLDELNKALESEVEAARKQATNETDEKWSQSNQELLEQYNVCA